MSISGATRLYGVVGDPVGLHSLSPPIHNRWMAEAKLDAAYVVQHVQSADAAADLVGAGARGFSGLNIDASSQGGGACGGGQSFA